MFTSPPPPIFALPPSTREEDKTRGELMGALSPSHVNNSFVSTQKGGLMGALPPARPKWLCEHPKTTFWYKSGILLVCNVRLTDWEIFFIVLDMTYMKTEPTNGQG